jgi:hypothetical protein
MNKTEKRRNGQYREDYDYEIVGKIAVDYEVEEKKEIA